MNKVEIEAAWKKADNARADSAHLSAEVFALCDTIDQQAALLAKYREALEFYAKEATYENGVDLVCVDGSKDYVFEIIADGGARARTALEQTP